MDSKRIEFVQKCGELLRTAKPSLISCELKLGKSIKSNLMPDHEYVVVTCANEHVYTICVEGNSLAAIVVDIFTNMLHK
jgi:hypothetical protein